VQPDRLGQRIAHNAPVSWLGQGALDQVAAAQRLAHHPDGHPAGPSHQVAGVTVERGEVHHRERRVKVGGGIAGHNGLRSISSHIGNDYRRVRIGIGHPGIKELVHSYVLADFAKSDRPWVEALCEAVADNAGLLATGRDSTFQNKVHLAMQARGFFDKDDDGAA